MRGRLPLRLGWRPGFARRTQERRRRLLRAVENAVQQMDFTRYNAETTGWASLVLVVIGIVAAAVFFLYLGA